MNPNAMNLFIVDDDPLMADRLKNYLSNRFKFNLNISSFSTSASVLKQVDKTTGIVILDYELEGNSGNEVMKSIKEINPKTEVIMLTSNEEVGSAIESFRNGATDYVIKDNKAGRKITANVTQIILYPYHIIVKRFGIDKYLAMFLLTFVTMGICVYFALKIFR